MSLIIFFGMALFIFLAGVLVLSISFYHWRKEKKLNNMNLKLNEQKS